MIGDRVRYNNHYSNHFGVVEYEELGSGSFAISTVRFDNGESWKVWRKDLTLVDSAPEGYNRCRCGTLTIKEVCCDCSRR